MSRSHHGCELQPIHLLSDDDGVHARMKMLSGRVIRKGIGCPALSYTRCSVSNSRSEFNNSTTRFLLPNKRTIPARTVRNIVWTAQLKNIYGILHFIRRSPYNRRTRLPNVSTNAAVSNKAESSVAFDRAKQSFGRGFCFATAHGNYLVTNRYKDTRIAGHSLVPHFMPLSIRGSKYRTPIAAEDNAITGSGNAETAKFCGRQWEELWEVLNDGLGNQIEQHQSIVINEKQGFVCAGINDIGELATAVGQVVLGNREARRRVGAADLHLKLVADDKGTCPTRHDLGGANARQTLQHKVGMTKQGQRAVGCRGYDLVQDIEPFTVSRNSGCSKQARSSGHRYQDTIGGGRRDNRSKGFKNDSWGSDISLFRFNQAEVRFERDRMTGRIYSKRPVCILFNRIAFRRFRQRGVSRTAARN